MKSQWSVVVLLCGLFMFLHNAEAVTYKYIDKNGMLCFADDLQSIPEQYRSQVALIEGEQRQKSALGADSTPGRMIEQKQSVAPIVSSVTSSVSGPEHVSRPRSMSITLRLLITLCVGIGVVVLAGQLAKLPRFADDAVARISLKTATVGLFLVYLVLAHGRDMVTVVRMAGRAVNTVQAESAAKGKKAAEGIKKLDAMFEQMQIAEEELKKAEEQSTTEQK